LTLAQTANATDSNTNNRAALSTRFKARTAIFKTNTYIALQQAREAGTSRMTHADILTGEDEHANVPARTEQVVHVGARAAV